MRYLRDFTTVLMALLLHSVAWAEIYETRDAQGNPVYSDSPNGADAGVVELPATNISDAPSAEDMQELQSETMADEQARENEKPVVFVDDKVDGGEESYDAMMRKERAYDRENPDAPHQVLDAEPRREVGDFGTEMTD